ncbi:MAG: hypothetical protein Q8L95_14260 [Burkholderiales bacterium]|nr:hypothetical protein [Burkholderiales bacterium]
MAQPNYGFAKRQRELAKKQKKEEKKRRKEAENAPPGTEGAQEQPAGEHPGETPPQQ